MMSLQSGLLRVALHECVAEPSCGAKGGRTSRTSQFLHTTVLTLSICSCLEHRSDNLQATVCCWALPSACWAPSQSVLAPRCVLAPLLGVFCLLQARVDGSTLSLRPLPLLMTKPVHYVFEICRLLHVGAAVWSQCVLLLHASAQYRQQPIIRFSRIVMRYTSANVRRRWEREVSLPWTCRRRVLRWACRRASSRPTACRQRTWTSATTSSLTTSSDEPGKEEGRTHVRLDVGRGL